ncbi:MAG: 50S ribosomal protein L3 N(5)-glutamine methyltransferase [Arenicellales bacterium]|jgi:ribosomal protein L3 glutamine methyltransferase|nr:50S ribosomal protein L3 N(5)-glutamine methyltransferase [Arenicellales bacterium]MDP6948080.1 50S ribosomal protein L3 N(5)-glutamine methyltransferase [Arenicellales bacterium]
MRLEICVAQVERRLADGGLYFGHGTDNAFDEAVWLVLAAVGLDAGADQIPWHKTLTDTEQAQVEALLTKRIRTRRPLAYLINQAWFAGLEFFVDERAIVPRSHLGEWIVGRFAPWLADRPIASILDLGTGSGCIAVALAHAFPAARVDASDLSSDALAVAAINTRRHDIVDRVRLLRSNLFTGLAGQRYDLIVCNPPYVSDAIMGELPDEYSYEPALAFAGGSEGLDFIDSLLREARTHLTDEGTLVVEAGSAKAAVEAAWPQVPFTWLTSRNGESVVFLLGAQELQQYRW